MSFFPKQHQYLRKFDHQGYFERTRLKIVVKLCKMFQKYDFKVETYISNLHCVRYKLSRFLPPQNSSVYPLHRISHSELDVLNLRGGGEFEQKHSDEFSTPAYLKSFSWQCRIQSLGLISIIF